MQGHSKRFCTVSLISKLGLRKMINQDRWYRNLRLTSLPPLLFELQSSEGQIPGSNYWMPEIYLDSTPLDADQTDNAPRNMQRVTDLAEARFLLLNVPIMLVLPLAGVAYCFRLPIRSFRMCSSFSVLVYRRGVVRSSCRVAVPVVVVVLTLVLRLRES
ncbi:hypothetical protein CSKR_109639 [Clonorchis sinensis]|uniref:Uncharacterized protein n=1 Tax=Clonorchis sinensis TaxID=79923 RepID=A0A8T1M931_CLOSI|nr:hypothetical protein CSKR_109639 [Clonorchis sinensis]